MIKVFDYSRFANMKFIYSLLGILAVVTGLQAFFIDGSKEIASGVYTHYNNYIIFKQSFFHLIENSDLYAAYPKEHFDLFKYSSTFALFFSVFAFLPDWLGIILWNSFNLLVLGFALSKVKILTDKDRLAIIMIALLEIITTVQNEQCNTLIIALFILSYVMFERNNYLLATLFICLSIYTKLYGIVAFSLILLYPGKLKSTLYSAMWMIVLFLMPLIIVSPSELIQQYKSWLALLQHEHPQMSGLSVMGWLETWFNLSLNKFVPVAIGVIVYCIPLLFYKRFKHPKYRILLLCSLSIWVVIFNHRAESASFIIAIIGALIWYFTSNKSLFNTVLIGAMFVLSIVSPTDLFPAILRKSLVEPYVLKAVPLIFVWFKIVYDLLWFDAPLEAESISR